MEKEMESIIKANKRQKIYMVILSIILIICIAFGGYYIYNEKTNNNQNHEEKDNSELVKEEDITDKNIVEALKNNVDIVGVNRGGNFVITDLYEKTITTENMRENDKLAVAILASPQTPSSKEELGQFATVTKKDFEDTYYKLFGKTTITHKDISLCPVTTYDNEKEIYTLNYSCGGGSSYTYLQYNYKYTKENNKYYVYQAVGVVNYADENVKIYKDVNGTIYKEYEENFTINENNYQDFSSYKWTFEKENEYYIFKSVERIN